ncbi:FAD-dependent oxidoreductase [Paenibacillus spiritus]|uniref:FAD-dependent oxidoreductase n=1 Tax=Paenibacillus spiritus TaxID=2496557 RepID=A0A5J5GBS2_9BACL|nr:FAD-dependent oxidoreductase [Paenibacillus spiritus]KAA9005343.1 FAD-dependent oxidoreductase [Paenibacillus spiritus]
MKLSAGPTFWEHTLSDPPSYPPLEDDAVCDVLIIGGGMAGALCAHRLSKLGADTVLIDKRAVGTGSTHANTGLLQASSDKRLGSFIHTFGKEKGEQFYRLSKDALLNLRQAAGELAIDPQFIPRSSLYYASTPRDADLLREEGELLRSVGIECELWDEKTIAARFPFSRSAALYTRGDAEVNPYRFVHGLLAGAASAGVRICSGTQALHLDYLPEGVVCRTKRGSISARQVIFTTGYETQEIKRDRGADLVNSYAIVTEPVPSLPKWHERCLIWETARPYLYFRTTPEGRIIAGGLDEPLTDPQEREVRSLSRRDKLLEKLAEHFPELQGVRAEFAWGAVFGLSRDGLPFIGPHPDYPHCYFIEGYGGNGTVCSMIGAELVTDTVAGRTRPELDLFSLTRSPKPAPAG